jgi:hypothetical protein
MLSHPELEHINLKLQLPAGLAVAHIQDFQGTRATLFLVCNGNIPVMAIYL